MKTILKINGTEILSVDKGVLNINPGQKITFMGFDFQVIERLVDNGNIIIEARTRRCIHDKKFTVEAGSQDI